MIPHGHTSSIEFWNIREGFMSEDMQQLSLYSLTEDFENLKINANGLISSPISYCDDMYLCQIG